MVKDKQKVIWDKNWKSQIQRNLQKTLISRFAREAYCCLNNFIDGRKDKLIIEAGCGTGRLCCLSAKDFPNSQLIGMDISQNSLDIARRLKGHIQTPNVSFVRSNLFQMPFPDNCFDVVFNEGVIEHFSLESDFTYYDAVQEMIRITKHGGKIIIAVPNWFNFPHTSYKWVLMKLNRKYTYGYEKSFKHSELIKLLSEMGMKEIEISGFYPSHGFCRLLGSGFGKIFDLLARFHNKIFDNLTDGFNRKFGFEIMIKGVKPRKEPLINNSSMQRTPQSTI